MTIKNHLLFILVSMLSIYHTQAQNMDECNCFEIGINKVWADSSGVKCYKIPINLLYNDASKGSKKIAVIKANSLQKSKLPPIVYFHGGPGVATLGIAQKYLESPFWKKLRENHDIIMMDYSGTGYSEPYLCDNIQESILALEESELSEADKKVKTLEYFINCRDSLISKKIPINTFTSFQIAADADEVRRKLGVEIWNVYGVSYGSHVAMQYMRHFENRIKNIVLDSPFPPNVKSESPVHTMNETLNHIQEVINKDPEMAKVFPNIIADFAATAERLDKKPIKMENFVLTGDDFAQIMFSTFYKTKLVSIIPLALKEFANGNDEALVEWVRSQYVNDGIGGDAYGKVNDFHYFAISGYEWKPRTYEETASYLSKEYSYLKSLAKKEEFDIYYAFRPESPDASYYEPIKSELPTLVLNCEFDPGCPISYGYSTIQQMPNAKMVIIPNASHSAATYSDCTQNLVKDFFDLPTAPINTECISEIKKVEFLTSNLKAELDKLIGNKK
ncbi:MAG: alpha/beta fold hydrolase [Aequorivita sp.]|nr:alpha/beta fold hydrolase [Aequorivita sp.]